MLILVRTMTARYVGETWELVPGIHQARGFRGAGVAMPHKEAQAHLEEKGRNSVPESGLCRSLGLIRHGVFFLI
jgi:hypothetical protein